MQELLKLLLEYRVTAGQLVLLYCIHANTKSSVPLLGVEKDLAYLKQNGLLTSENTLTPNSLVLVLKAENLFVVPSRKNRKTESPDFLERVYEYRDLFPNKKLPSGKAARSNIEDLKKKFADFFTKYPNYDWDLVYVATEAYIEAYRKHEYKFMKTASYYISKDRESDLASDCQFLLEGGDVSEIKNSYFTII